MAFETVSPPCLVLIVGYDTVFLEMEHDTVMILILIIAASDPRWLSVVGFSLTLIKAIPSDLWITEMHFNLDICDNKLCNIVVINTTNLSILNFEAICRKFVGNRLIGTLNLTMSNGTYKQGNWIWILTWISFTWTCDLNVRSLSGKFLSCWNL